MLYLTAKGLPLIFLICIPLSQCKLNKYCQVCQNHTMCQYKNLGSDCIDAGGSGVTSQEINEIIHMHNWYRGLIAGGHEGRGAGGSQPKGANIMKLRWDSDLAQVAQRWADQCRLQHDTCRDDPRWKVGQNIYWKWKYPNHQVNWTEAITSWYKEVSLFNPKEVEKYRFDSGTGHFTQIIWHDTVLVGCGRRDYGYNKLYVCNYGPTGNWIGEPIYSVGEPCSRCPKGTHCDGYLCDSQQNGTGKVDPAKETVFGGPETTTKKPKDSPVQKPSQRVADSDPKRNPAQKDDVSLNADENVILDDEILSAVDEIRTTIQNLLKKVINKIKSQH